MKAISVTLEGEEAVFCWKDGRAYCVGYDLESEKAVLALTSFGRGIGVLLVAMNDSCNSEAELISEVQKFIDGYERVAAREYLEWPKGQLLFEYLSYSRDSSIRWGGMDTARLSERHYKRILNDPDVENKSWMARLKELPEKYYYLLLQYGDVEIKRSLAYAYNCPLSILEVLARDEEAAVRQLVAINISASEEILEGLSKDESASTRRHVAHNSACPRRLLERLAQDQDKSVRRYAQNNLVKSKGFEV